MLSDIIDNVGRECGWEVVTSNIVNSTDVTTKMLLGMCNRVVNEMASGYTWPKLRKSHSITLVDGQATYALPGDFSYAHWDTFWNQTDHWRLFGPLTQQDYAAIKGYGNLAAAFSQFQIRGITDNQLTITPTPGSDDDSQVIIFEYTTARPIRPQTWEAGQIVASGDYTFYNGIYYKASTSGTTAGTNPTDDSGVTWAEYSGPYEKFLADTDVSVLSERILEQGVMERFAAIKQLNVVPLFLNQLEEEYGRTLTGKTLYAGGHNRSYFQHAFNGKVNFGHLRG